MQRNTDPANFLCLDLRIKFALWAAVILFACQQGQINASPSPDLLNQAISLVDKNHDNSALICLNKLIKKEPHNASAFCERALVFYRAGRYDSALADSNKAIALNPKLAKAYLYRAAIHLDQAHVKEALADSNKAIFFEPGLAISYSIRAQAYQALEKHQKAVEDCNKAIAMDLRNAKYYLVRAAAYRELKLYKKSLQDCNKALNLNSKKAMPHIERGLTYLCIGKLQKALDDYTAAITIYPQHPLAYILRSIVSGMLGQYKQEIEDLTLAASISPKNEKIYELRASAYYEIGLLRKAIEDSETATTLNPSSSKGYLTAAKSHEELGSYEKAIELRSKLLGIEKCNASFWSDRASDYNVLGKFALAQLDWQNAKRLATPYELSKIKLDNPLIDFNDFLSSNRFKEIIDNQKQLRDKSVVLPLDILDCGHMGVPVLVNGSPLKFMLDTGCAHTQLWKKAISVLTDTGISRLKSTRATGAKYTYGCFVARTLELGKLGLSNVPMTVDDGLTDHKNMSGFLAGNILENFVVTIDYRNKKLILANFFKQDSNKETIIVPMRMRDHCPNCTVKLNGKVELSALLDSGTPISMAPDALLKPVLEKKLSYGGYISGPWLGKLSSQRISLKKLSLGAFDFATPIFDVYRAADAPSAATEIILGNDFLSRFKTVTFDYPCRRVIFEI